VIGRYVLFNQGAGTFVNAGALTGSSSVIAPSAVALGDVDSDGDLDAVEAKGFLHRNNGNGTFAPPETLPLTSKTAPILMDLDLDGDLDVVVSGPRVLKNVTRQLSRGLPARPGRLATLELRGSPGAAWGLFAGAPATPFAVPPYGFVQLNPSTVAQLSSGMFPASGHSTFAVTLPNSAALVGLAAMTQAVIFEPAGPRVTGAEWVTILSF
jgi:hypothetical protein